MQHSPLASLRALAPCSSTASKCPSFFPALLMSRLCPAVGSKWNKSKHFLLFHIPKSQAQGRKYRHCFTLYCLILWYAVCETQAGCVDSHTSNVRTSWYYPAWIFDYCSSWLVSLKVFHYSHPHSQSHILRAAHKNPPTANMSLHYTSKPTMNLLTGIFPYVLLIVPLSKAETLHKIWQKQTKTCRTISQRRKQHSVPI